jgi:cytosine/adenosine deaminase-related metal-dependent hydrolase
MKGAASIGLDRDIGSIEPGKLADILVLDANPLDDIRNTAKARYVVKNGVVYDAATLDEIWPTARKFPTSIWARDEQERDKLRITPRGP